MKICTCCSAQNSDEAIRCKVCGEHAFFVKRPSVARKQEPASATSAVRAAFSSRSTSVVICLGLMALGGEIIWRQNRFNQLARELSAVRSKVLLDRAAVIADQDRIAHARLDKEESEHRFLMGNPAFLSGEQARERHKEEWALRVAHDPRLAKSVIETNLLTMEQVGRDATLAAQNAIEKVAHLAAPPDSRVEVAADGDGFRVRVAFMMSRLSPNEAGAVTKYHSIAALKAEIQKLSARVLQDLYTYCGSRGIKSIAVTCNHTLRQTVVPMGATDEERRELLQRAKPVPARLYRVSLDHSHAQAIVDWRDVSVSRVSQLGTVEYDGFANLEITQASVLGYDADDPAGQLQF